MLQNITFWEQMYIDFWNDISSMLFISSMLLKLHSQKDAHQAIHTFIYIFNTIHMIVFRIHLLLQIQSKK